MLNTSNLKDSIIILKEAYSLYLQNSEPILNSVLQDSCVKRFEYTYETAKKIMNKYLKYEFDKTDLPINNVFREIFGLGLIENYERWIDYREKRNNTSHEYDLTKARSIISVLEVFINDVEFLLQNLEKTK